MSELTEKDLLCIAKNIQYEIFPALASDAVDEEKKVVCCFTCKYNNECYCIKDGDIARYRHNFNIVRSKLQSLTGVYLGFDDN